MFFPLSVEQLRHRGPVTVEDRGKVRLTQFFNQEGDFVRETLHINGTTILTGDGGELFDRGLSRALSILRPKRSESAATNGTSTPEPGACSSTTAD